MTIQCAGSGAHAVDIGLWRTGRRLRAVVCAQWMQARSLDSALGSRASTTSAAEVVEDLIREFGGAFESVGLIW